MPIYENETFPVLAADVTVLFDQYDVAAPTTEVEEDTAENLYTLPAVA